MTTILRALLALALLQCVISTTAQAQRKVHERRAVVPSGFIRIFLLNGDVNVTGWDKDSLLVVGIVHEPAGERFSVAVTKGGAKLGLWSDSEQNLKPAHISVYVPRRSQVWVKTTSANATITGVTGGIDLFSVSGSITATGSPREVYAETMGGEINVSAVTAAARLKTASGAIKIAGNISDLTAVSISGDINSANTTFGRARLESVDGHIRYYGAIPRASNIEMINHAGSITLVIPSHTSADFAFNLYEAELTDEFGIRKRWSASNNFKAKEMTFGLGERPAARVTIRSFRGAVALRRLPEGK